jgi:hypothetical protein
VEFRSNQFINHDNYCFTLEDAYNISVYDSVCDVNGTKGTLVAHTTKNETYFTNLTYRNVDVETVSSKAILYRQWYADISVTNNDGALQNANITIYNVSGAEVDSGVTDASGKYRSILIEYIKNSSATMYNTPHMINVNYSTEGNTTIFNLTSEQNVDHQVYFNNSNDICFFSQYATPWLNVSTNGASLIYNGVINWSIQLTSHK